MQMHMGFLELACRHISHIQLAKVSYKSSLDPKNWGIDSAS